MPQYKPSDDGTVIDGRVVVYMGRGQQSTALVERSTRAAVGRATAAVLAAAAEGGVPFCEDCERVRRELDKAGRE